MAVATRTERDLIGEREVPALARWGIHTLRAAESFLLSGRWVAPGLVHAYLTSSGRVNRLGHVAEPKESS